MKNFLKPTKAKIILSLVLFAAMNFIPAIPCVKGNVFRDITTNLHWSVCKPVDGLITGGIFDIFGLGFFGLHGYGFEVATLFLILTSYFIFSVIFYFFKNE